MASLAKSAAFGFDTLEIVVPNGNLNKIGGLQDIGKDTKYRVGLCNPFVACGPAAKTGYGMAGVQPPEPALESASANALIDGVATGKLDAAVVYRTDVAAHRVPGTEAHRLITA